MRIHERSVGGQKQVPHDPGAASQGCQFGMTTLGIGLPAGARNEAEFAGVIAKLTRRGPSFRVGRVVVGGAERQPCRSLLSPLPTRWRVPFPVANTTR